MSTEEEVAMSAKTLEISKEQFHSIANLDPPPSQVFTTERAWFQHGDMLGVVLHDNVDHDWSFVVLARDLSEQHRCFNLGTDYQSQDQATRAMLAILNSFQGNETFAQGDEFYGAPLGMMS